MRLKSTQNRYGFANPLCSGAERCIIVFVTPWCSACHASIGFINAFRARLHSMPGTRFVVIAGGDSPDRIDEMAQRIGGEVFLDYDRQFQNAARCSAVPHWYVVDSNRRVLKDFGGTPADESPQVLDWFIKEQLGLKLAS